MIFLMPEYALFCLDKIRLLRNIIHGNNSNQANPGNLRTIAHFMMERFDNPLLFVCGHFPWEKVKVCNDSAPQNAILTKIFINCQIKRKYNPFR